MTTDRPPARSAGEEFFWGRFIRYTAEFDGYDCYTDRPTPTQTHCGDNKVFSMLSHRHISGSSLTKSIALEIAGSHDLY
jgi:hypothetical protein